MAVVSPALLILLWWHGSDRRIVRGSYLFGIGMFAAGTYWIYHSLHLFGDAIAPVAAVITVGFVLCCALYLALLGWVVARFFPPSMLPGESGCLVWFVLVAPALWSACELFRGWFLTGFPWLNAGYSQIDTPLAGYAPLLGVYGVGWLTVVSAGALACLFVCRARAAWVVLLAVAAFWLGGSYLRTVLWSDPVGEAISVRIVQGNIEQHHKFMAELLIPSIEKYKRLSRLEEPVDLVVWPESAIPTFFYKIDRHLAEFSQEALSRGTRVITGGFIYNRDTKEFHNSLRTLDDPNAYYHKQHLVPFGEYMPFRSLLGILSDLITIPMSDLTPGVNAGPGLSIKGHQIGASICFEDAFGEEMAQALPHSALLLNVSNDSWFGDSSAPHQHLEMARMRALELGRPLIRATNTGVSALVDHRGQVLHRIPGGRADAIDARVQPRQGETPYTRWTNRAITLSILLILIGVYGWSRRRKEPQVPD